MGLQSQLFRGDPRLEAAAVSDPAHITRGASGPHVHKIQTALMRVDNASISPIEVQGSTYGASTAAAVLAYKRKRGIINRSYETQADDIVGKMTMASLDSELLRREPVLPPVQIVLKPGFAMRPVHSRSHFDLRAGGAPNFNTSEITMFTMDTVVCTVLHAQGGQVKVVAANDTSPFIQIRQHGDSAGFVEEFTVRSDEQDFDIRSFIDAGEVLVVAASSVGTHHPSGAELTVTIRARKGLDGRVELALPGKVGFDTVLTVDRTSARKLRKHFTFCLRYLTVSPPLSSDEAQGILDAGLALMPIMSRNRSNWHPTSDLGTEDGAATVKALTELSFPHVTVWLDVESLAPPVKPDDNLLDNLVAYCNAWIAAVRGVHYLPGCYLANSFVQVEGMEFLKKLASPFTAFWQGNGPPGNIVVKGPFHFHMRQDLPVEEPVLKHDPDLTLGGSEGFRWLRKPSPPAFPRRMSRG
jgi:hypothetical protein